MFLKIGAVLLDKPGAMVFELEPDLNLQETHVAKRREPTHKTIKHLHKHGNPSLQSFLHWYPKTNAGLDLVVPPRGDNHHLLIFYHHYLR